MTRILVVEDEEKLRAVMDRGLREQGYEVVAVDDGEKAWNRVSTESFDCILLDRMLPGRDGLTLLRDFRSLGIRTPTLVITARGELDDRVEGLDSGADDYLTKPFAWAEFLARVRACVRRAEKSSDGVLIVGAIRLDLVHRKLSVGPESIDLTDRESELLEYFIRRAGQTVTRDQLATEVWHEPELGLTNVIDVYVGRLRRRLDRVGEADRIKTVRGSGYSFEV